MSTEELHNAQLDWVTQEFLQKVLFHDKEKWRITDVNKNCNPVTNKGDNYASSMYRIKVTLLKRNEKEDETVQLSLIVKTIPVLKEIADRISEFSVFSTEIKMLSETIPNLTELLDNAFPKEDNVLCAKFYHALPSAPFNLILEDLCDSGYGIRNRRKGLDIKHCEIVMKTIARFHAASVALHGKNELAVEVYNENVFVNISDKFKEVFKTTALGIAAIVETWPETGKKYAAKLRNLADTLPLDVLEAFRNDNLKFKVLNHGDLWVNNMMFHYDNSTGEVDKVKFVDFQISYYTSPALDLQYFLHTSPNEEVRVHHMDHLLRIYHTELCTTLSLMKNEDHIISYEEFIEDYGEKYVFGMFASLFLLPLALADPKDAGHDTNSAEVMDEKSKKKAAVNRFSNPKYTNILKLLLPLFESKGVL